MRARLRCIDGITGIMCAKVSRGKAASLLPASQHPAHKSEDKREGDNAFPYVIFGFM